MATTEGVAPDLSALAEESRNNKIREIYRMIALGKNQHGSFLTAFAEAVMKADRQNFLILKPVAIQFMEAYKLEAEFDGGGHGHA